MPERKTILLAEDNPDEREMMKVLLEGAGYAVAAVGDGKQAVQSLKASTFDLIVLDIMMPKVDGVEICNAVKHSRKFQGTPVLLVSALGKASPASEERWRQETHADAFVAKPFNTHRFVQLVGELLQRRIADPEADPHARPNVHLRDVANLMSQQDRDRRARIKASKQRHGRRPGTST